MAIYRLAKRVKFHDIQIMKFALATEMFFIYYSQY